MTSYRLLIAGRPIARFDVAKITGTYKVPDVTLKRGVVADTSTLATWINNARGGIALERGVILDPSFAAWLQGAKMRYDVVLQPIDDAGKPLASYSLTNSWVTNWKGPNLNANANAVLIQHIIIEHEGFEIDQPDPKHK